MTLLGSLLDPAVPLRRRLWRVAAIALLAAACAYRVALIVQYNPVDHIWSDPQRHWEQGVDTLRDDPMSLTDPILYQLYVGALAKLTLKLPALVAYFTSLLSLAGPWLWYRYLRELTRERDWALAGWIALAALPSWSAIYSYFMQETLMLPLLGAALWATWRARRKGDVPSFAWATAAWTAAGLTRGICFPLAAVALAWIWLAQPRRVPRALAGVLIVASLFVPLSIRSLARAHVLAPHGIGTMNQLYQRSGAIEVKMDFRRQGAFWSYGFASPAVLRPPFEPLSDWKSHRAGTVRFSIDMDQGSRDWQAAAASLPPWTLRRFAWLTGDNLVHLFFSQSWPDTNLERAIGRVNHWLRWLWAPLGLCALGVTLARWRRTREGLLPALLLTWFLVQGVFPLCVNEGRYRKPFEGLLLAQCVALAAAGARREQSSSPAVEPPAGLELAPGEPRGDSADGAGGVDEPTPRGEELAQVDSSTGGAG